MVYILKFLYLIHLKLAIIAYDHGTPISLETTTTLRINVRISNKKQPYFSESGGQILSFTGA